MRRNAPPHVLRAAVAAVLEPTGHTHPAAIDSACMLAAAIAWLAGRAPPAGAPEARAMRRALLGHLAGLAADAGMRGKLEALQAACEVGLGVWQGVCQLRTGPLVGGGHGFGGDWGVHVVGGAGSSLDRPVPKCCVRGRHAPLVVGGWLPFRPHARAAAKSARSVSESSVSLTPPSFPQANSIPHPPPDTRHGIGPEAARAFWGEHMESPEWTRELDLSFVLSNQQFQIGGVPAVACALCALCHHGLLAHPEDAMVAAVHYGWDTDTIAAMAGAWVRGVHAGLRVF